MTTNALMDMIRGDFRTSRPADELNARFQTLLGLPHRYGPARLALGRSLGIQSQPDLQLNSFGLGRPIKGEQLFGQGVELSCWLTLVTEHVGQGSLSRRDFQALITAHWHRGLYTLWDDWKVSAGEFDAFVARLVRHANTARGQRLVRTPAA
jgi:hypothetical protein